MPIQRARTVVDSGISELAEAVEKGEVTVARAETGSRERKLTLTPGARKLWHLENVNRAHAAIFPCTGMGDLGSGTRTTNREAE